MQRSKLEVSHLGKLMINTINGSQLAKMKKYIPYLPSHNIYRGEAA